MTELSTLVTKTVDIIAFCEVKPKHSCINLADDQTVLNGQGFQQP